MKKENINNDSNEKNESKLKKIKEMWKDKKGRAKLQLCLYAIFFIGVIIFSRILNSYNKNIESNEQANTSFLVEIKDNYEYEIEINIDDDIYKYHGKILGNNGTITREISEIEDYYHIMNNKYYVLDTNGNYILTTKEEIYPNIDYRYLNIEIIKEFINISTKENNVYKVKLSDLILNNNSEEYITITIDETNKSLEVDYTELFKLDNKSLTKEIIKITYKNINNIISLEE